MATTVPSCLIRTGKIVQVFVDAELRGDQRLIFHPNLNQHSLTIAPADLDRFFASTGHRVTWTPL